MQDKLPLHYSTFFSSTPCPYVPSFMFLISVNSLTVHPHVQTKTWSYHLFSFILLIGSISICCQIHFQCKSLDSYFSDHSLCFCFWLLEAILHSSSEWLLENKVQIISLLKTLQQIAITFRIKIPLFFGLSVLDNLILHCIWFTIFFSFFERHSYTTRKRRKREGEGGEIFHPLVHFLYSSVSQGWVSPKPRSQELLLGVSRGCRHLSSWVMHGCFVLASSRDLDGKWWKQMGIHTGYWGPGQQLYPL